MSSTPNQRWLRSSSGFLCLLKFFSGLLDHLRPARLLGLQPLAERLGRAGTHFGALLREALFHVGSIERLDQLAVELGDDVFRNAARSDHALERAGLEARQALLGDGRCVGRGRYALRTG